MYKIGYMGVKDIEELIKDIRKEMEEEAVSIKEDEYGNKEVEMEANESVKEFLRKRGYLNDKEIEEVDYYLIYEF